MEHIGRITEHSIEEGKKGDYHKITVEPEKWGYNVFSPHLFDLCKKDNRVKVTYEINGKYRDVKGIEISEEVAMSPKDETMSKADWERKDRAIHRCGIAKSFIEVLGDDRDWTPEIEAAANRAFAWVMEIPAAKPPKADRPGDKPLIVVRGKPVRSRKAKLSELDNILRKGKGYTARKCTELLVDSPFTVASTSQLKDEQLDAVLEWAKQVPAKEHGNLE